MITDQNEKPNYMITNTRTYSVLELSPKSFNEIKDKLEKKGYRSKFLEKEDDGLIIDMIGIAIKEEKLNEFATEFEYFKWFRLNASFGPAEDDVILELNERYEEETGKKVPEGWGREE